MRSVPSYISERLKRNIQTRANDSAPSVDIWVGRPSTLLVDDKFLERQTVLSAKVSDVSIAVCHPRIKRNNTHIYMAYISGGVARVVGAKHKTKMAEHEWYDTGFEQNATAVSIAYDGTMPKANGGDVEFVTELYPWVFWVNETVLYGQRLYSNEEPVILAETNCTDVSAIRAMWSSTGGFDFGLVVFFILEGKLYYRQLIGGEWMDAELVSFGPDGITWQEVAAFRTWDYRIGIQAKTTDGSVYDLFTQFMGVGKQLTEHIVADLKPYSDLIKIDYTNSTENEHLEVGINPIGERIYAWSSVPVSARNVDDGFGNYGLIVHVTLDYPVTNVANNSSAFSMIDSSGMGYSCNDASVSEDGRTLRLTFVDFNLAEGKELTVSYTPGTVRSPAVAMEAFDFTFTPNGLVAPDIPVPEPVEAWNIDSEGTKVAIRFTESLTGDITGYDTPAGYKQQSIDLSGAVVTTLNQYSSSYSGAKAIDGNNSTYWRGTTTTNWIAFQLSEPKAVTSLRLITAAYYIKTFTLSGSADGETWTQIGEVYTVSNPSTGVWNEFSIDNDTEYLHYRLDILTGSSRIYLYELDLKETVAVGNETKLAVSGPVYNYVPGGELSTESRKVTKVVGDPDDDHIVVIHFPSGNVNNLQNMYGEVSIRYSGGTLMGLGGPVADFDLKFLPEGLTPKNHPGENEHISSVITPVGNLIQISYSSTSETEHIEAAINPNGTLIHIDDI